MYKHKYIVSCKSIEVVKPVHLLLLFSEDIRLKLQRLISSKNSKFDLLFDGIYM